MSTSTLTLPASARKAHPAHQARAGKGRVVGVENGGWHRGSGGAITITLADGRSVSAECANALGCPDRPLDDAARAEILSR